MFWVKRYAQFFLVMCSKESSLQKLLPKNGKDVDEIFQLLTLMHLQLECFLGFLAWEKGVGYFCEAHIADVIVTLSVLLKNLWAYLNETETGLEYLLITG